MPACLIHLTDLHIPPEGALVGGLDTAPRLARVIAAIAQAHGPGSALPAAAAIITGDLVRDGEGAAYRRLAGLLAGLPCPVLPLLGNHDDRTGFRGAFPEAPAGFAQATLATPLGLCIGLDTLDAGRAGGRLCAARRGWLAAQLAGSVGPVILALHHPPFAVGMPGMDAIALAEPDALWAVLAPHAGRIRMLLHGHLHRPIAAAWRGIPVASHPGTAFDLPLGFTQVPPPVTGREPPSFAVVIGTDMALVAHTHTLAEVPA